MFEKLYDLDNLYVAFHQIAEASGWKEETQRYRVNLMVNLISLSNNIRDGKYRPTVPRSFITYERGKPRFIESRTVNDRVVQRVVHDQVMLPTIYPRLIYDNAASLKGRGTDFFRARLLYHLSQFAAVHGNNGYILLIDFKKFFDNIRHDKLIEMLYPIIPDQQVMDFLIMLINENAIDVSYMTDEEYANCMNVPFNNIDYRVKLYRKEIQCTGQKFMHKSMGIGSQLSQDVGLFYPHRVDNYCKIVKGIKGYGRYMDDTYVIHESKDFLWDLLNNGIMDICNEYGLFINEKKTQIVNLKHEFSILQTRYKVHPDASITIMPNNDTFQRERRKLKKQDQMLHEAFYYNLTYDDIQEAYQSWRGNIVKQSGSDIQSLKNMDDLYNKLFIDPFVKGGYKDGKNSRCSKS